MSHRDAWDAGIYARADPYDFYINGHAVARCIPPPMPQWTIDDWYDLPALARLLAPAEDFSRSPPMASVEALV